jgi:peptidoglycan hydrolase CwlO-like protein
MLRVAVPVGLVVAAILAIPATASTPVPLQQRLDAAKAKEGRLRGAVGADSAQIEGFQGRIDDLRTRLVSLESSLAIERRLLEGSRAELRVARAHLQQLKVSYARDRGVLAAQLVAEYKADRPDIVSVIMDAHGFADLLERADAVRAVARRNSQETARVRDSKQAVGRQAARLRTITDRRRQIARATLLQTQEVDQLRNGLINRQLQFIRARDRKTTRLSSVRTQRRRLEQRLNAIEARAARAALGSLPAGLGGGSFGFFPAAGTNYSVGSEPELATRLDRLGKALHLHLIGISGYRTPQHSVEVGGFANDPHTRGEASDTPGVEGVPEATLRRFGLTRPFGGAAEADHIQLS